MQARYAFPRMRERFRQVRRLHFLPRTAELRLVVHLPRFVFAPVEAGESAGRIQVFWDGEQIDEWDLRYAEGAALAVRERKR